MAKINAISLAQVVQSEVEQYAGTTHDAKLYTIADWERQIFTLVCVPQNQEERPAWVMLMARVLGEYIVIEEDTALDKPLYEALIANHGIPREKIILSYRDENLPS
jgi:hypothetical protein